MLVQLTRAYSLTEQNPHPTCDSPEELRSAEAECCEDAAGTEVTLAATAASTGDLPADWTTKQVCEWKDRNPWQRCFVCRKAKLSEKTGFTSCKWISGDVSEEATKEEIQTSSGQIQSSSTR